MKYFKSINTLSPSFVRKPRGLPRGVSPLPAPMFTPRPFWGEMHTHTCYCENDPQTSLEATVSLAREYLDFWAPAEHASEICRHAGQAGGAGRPFTNKVWDHFRRIIRENDMPGKFVPIHGYEWSSMTYGDHNVYCFENDIPRIINPPTLAKLYHYFKGRKVLIIPHHPRYQIGARGMNWKLLDPRVAPVAEIYSWHGSSEGNDTPYRRERNNCMGPMVSGGALQDALAMGIKIGFIASSDNHDGIPGQWDHGLVAAYAPDLSRAGIYQAFQERKVYAVTGDRILLRFAINGAPMGSEITRTGKRRIAVAAEGQGAIHRIEIIKNNRLIHTAVHKGAWEQSLPAGPYKLRLRWGWGPKAPEAGKPRPGVVGHPLQQWLFTLKVSGGVIKAAHPCFQFPPGDHLRLISRQECRWESVTSPWYFWTEEVPAKEMILTIDGSPDTTIILCANHEPIRLKLADWFGRKDILAVTGYHPPGPGVKSADRPPAGYKVVLETLIPRQAYTAQLQLDDDSKENPVDFYYARVIQENGQVAWSSPIWVH